MTRAVFAAVLLLAAQAFAAPVRLCIVGDSISAGYSPSTYGWAVPIARLNAGTDFGVKNVSVSGDKVYNASTRADAHARFDAGVRGRGCTWVAFLVGTNDLPDGTAASVIWLGSGGVGGLRPLVDVARAEGARVLLLALLPRGTGASWSTDLGTRLLAFNALMQAYANGSTIVYADTYTAMLEPASSPPRLLLAGGGGTDGLHPNNAGQHSIAQTVQAAVLAAGGW